MSHRLYYRLQLAALRSRTTANAALAPLGLTASQLGALYAIRAGTERPKDLASILQVRPSAVTALTARLQRDGLIEIVPAEHDRRSTRLALTELGEATTRDAQPILRTLNKAFSEAFDEEELDTIVRFLDMAGHLGGTR